MKEKFELEVTKDGDIYYKGVEIWDGIKLEYGDWGEEMHYSCYTPRLKVKGVNGYYNFDTLYEALKYIDENV